MKHKKSVIPGFGLSFGIVMAILGLIVIIPLCSLVFFSFKLSPHDFLVTVTRQRVLASYKVSIITALIASLINAVMGMIIAWVLVRYDFPGKKIMDGIIEMPFALPTAVAGIALTHLTIPEGWVGRIFANVGIKIAYTRIGITVALFLSEYRLLSEVYSRFLKRLKKSMRRQQQCLVLPVPVYFSV